MGPDTQAQCYVWLIGPSRHRAVRQLANSFGAQLTTSLVNNSVTPGHVASKAKIKAARFTALLGGKEPTWGEVKKLSRATGEPLRTLVGL